MGAPVLSRCLGQGTLRRTKVLEIAETTGVVADLPSPKGGESFGSEALSKGLQAPGKLVYRRSSGWLGFEAASHQVVEGGRDAPVPANGFGPAL